MPHILVADKIASEGLALLDKVEGITYEIKQGLSPEELARVIGKFDGILIRSGVKITAAVLAEPGRLAAIARAGVGVDNVDLDAATRAGIVVLNTPDANTISTAEHTIALMLALHRHIPEAQEHVKHGEWKRSQFQGEQLEGKTLGVVGLGRIGRAVAQRALAFDMNVIGYDPFVSESGAVGRDIKLAGDLDELLAAADVVTLHASLSSDTRHLIGKEQIGRMKPGAKLINCARGALVDEAALAEALHSGHLRGAAVDVFEHEPPTGSPLLTAPNVVLTPHLAASTAEAQARVSVDAVQALLAYIQRGEIRSAVNVTGLPRRMSARGRAFVDLCSRIGALLSPWCGRGVERVNVTTFGEALEELSGTLAWQAVVSILNPHLDVRLSLVNARDQARQRGITVEHSAQSAESSFPETITVSVVTQKQRHEVQGTVFADGRPRVVSIDGYRMELIPEGHMAVISNDDQPGVIGLVGQTVGNAGVNIADMALSRRDSAAMMVLKVDTPMPESLCNELRAARPPIRSLHTVELPPLPEGQGG